MLIVFMRFPLVFSGSELDNLIDRLMKKRQDPSFDRNHAISLLVWITKALVMRSYSKVEQSIQEVLDLFSYYFD